MTLIECLTPEGVRSSLEHAAIAQKLGQVVCFIDLGRHLNLPMARALGVDVTHLLVSQPDGKDQAQEIIGHLEKSKAISLTIVA